MPSATRSRSASWSWSAAMPAAGWPGPTPTKSARRRRSTCRSAGSPGAATIQRYRQVFAAQFLPDESRETWDAFNALQRAPPRPRTSSASSNLRHHRRVRPGRPVRCPTLVVHARRDRRVPVQQAHELAAQIPGQHACACSTAVTTSLPRTSRPGRSSSPSSRRSWPDPFASARPSAHRRHGQRLDHGPDGAADVLRVGRPVAHRDPQDVAPAPSRPGHPGDAVGRAAAAVTAPGALVVAEGDADLGVTRPR